MAEEKCLVVLYSEKNIFLVKLMEPSIDWRLSLQSLDEKHKKQQFFSLIPYKIYTTQCSESIVNYGC